MCWLSVLLQHMHGILVSAATAASAPDAGCVSSAAGACTQCMPVWHNRSVETLYNILMTVFCAVRCIGSVCMATVLFCCPVSIVAGVQCASWALSSSRPAAVEGQLFSFWTSVLGLDS